MATKAKFSRYTVLWPPHVNNALAPAYVYNAHHMLVLRRFNMIAAQAGDNDSLGNKCSDIEAEPMRRGGRLPEQLIAAREREGFKCRKMSFLDW